MNRKMAAYVQELPTSNGETVQIITHFGERTIDPEATKAAIAEPLKKTPEYAKMQNHQAKINAQRQIANEAWALIALAEENGDAGNAAVHTSAYKAALSAIAVLEDELRPLINEYRAVWYKLYDENPEYFPCGIGQCECEDGEYDNLKEKHVRLAEHQRLTRSGEIIPDWRDIEYQHKANGKWRKDKIKFIKEALPEGSILVDELTPEIQAEISEQQEHERIASMSDEAREKAMEAALDSLADEADRLSRRAAIREKSFDAKAYYRDKKGAIEKKYARSGKSKPMSGDIGE